MIPRKFPGDVRRCMAVSPEMAGLVAAFLFLGSATVSQAQQQLKAVGNGTAFAINSAGEFLTNYHVVKGCTALRMHWNGVGHDATVINSDEQNDLAVVRSSGGGIEPLHFREGKGIRPGDGIVALGFPYSGLLSTNAQVTTGDVSALTGIRDDIRFMQLTAPVQPGNSGGPLLDLSGNVVGVVSARINELAVVQATGSLPQNINFAIKSAVIRAFLEAHQITYEMAPSSAKLEPADVAETAMKSTLLLECLSEPQETIAARAPGPGTPPSAPSQSGTCDDSDEQITRPIASVYRAINSRDIDLYATQWDDSATSHDVFVNESRTKQEKVDKKKTQFLSWEKVNLTIQDIAILNRTRRLANVQVTYSMMFQFRVQEARSRSGIIETYALVCSNEGRWVIQHNEDEINIKE
jgi:S1-C subfamily serine protease